jgi:acetyl-CoA carboxylase biotin carboxyl carrier protein
LPESGPSDSRRTHRSAVERTADHAAIERLTSELLPSLIAKLGATGLGELEVREGQWRVRLRRPVGGRAAASGAHAPARDRAGRAAERAERSERGERAERAERSGDRHGGSDDGRATATSPAVGTYRPRRDLSAGDRVQAGDALGAVDMLGIPQEIVAPADGVVGSSLVEAGDAVEYGQPLLVIELRTGTGTGATPAGGADATNGTGG